MEQIEGNNQFTVEQVCAKCGLAPYILRYWEIHFPELRGADGKPKPFYTSNDIALVWRIKRLLYVELLTLEQAKKKLSSEKLFPLSEPGFSAPARAQAANPQEAQQPAQEGSGTRATEPAAQPAGQAAVQAPSNAAPQERRQQTIRLVSTSAPPAAAPAQASPEQIRAEQERRYQEALRRAQAERRKVLRRRQVEAALIELRELRAKLG